MKKISTQLLLSVLSLLYNFTTINAQVNISDSLALVDLYNSTNGPNWFNHNNWLNGQVKDWYGITLNNNRVSSVDLNNNNLSGKMLPSLGNLSSLTSLFLYANKLTGNIPSSIGNLSSVIYIWLFDNQLTGNIPAELGNLSNLQQLILSGNQLSGSIPAELGNLSNVTNLNLSINQLSGNIPSSIGNLSNLQELYFHYNNLSGSIPAELGNLSNLRELVLNNNQLSGSIPSELGNLSSLNGLILISNQLSGEIPSQLGNLSNLQRLFLGGNQLSDNIPSGLGNITSLQIVDLSGNQLSGNIPAELGNLFNLENLSLEYNQLSGNVPFELSNLSKLQSLTLNNNKLSGTIPSFAAPSLNTLNLSHNQFTFDGMEYVAQTFPFATYGRQARIPLHINGNTLSVSAGGTLSNNTYVWLKKGKVGYTKISADSIFNPTESGTYVVSVQNKIVTMLKLFSDAVYYTAPTSLNAIASDKPVILNEKLSAYPNPAKSLVTVTFNFTGNCNLKLMNNSGKVLQAKTINAIKDGNRLQLDVSKYPLGIYLIGITDACSKTEVIKLNKE